MGDATEASVKQQTGLLHFATPDFSVPPEERGLFAFPANLEVVEHSLPLHDARTDRSLLTGCKGLDNHGFTYVKHRSALSEADDPAINWYSGNNIEDTYIPETEKLICELTGAKRAVVNNIAIRRRLVDKSADPKFYLKRGDILDKELAKLPNDVPLVYGKDFDGSAEPARAAHIDYTLRGLKDTARFCRHDITLAAQPALEAEDARSDAVPRYAAFTVWRPIRTVKRDPLAVCDVRTVDARDCVSSKYRALSNVNADGEYMMESVSILPPQNPTAQKWYWMPEQKSDEVLVVKFADTLESDGKSMIGGICGAGGAPHLSPVIPGTEEEEPRVSIEARVMAFW